MTIYALSSGPGISGIAVIRVSGPETRKVIELLTNGSIPAPKLATHEQNVHAGYSILLPTVDFSASTFGLD